MSGAITPVQLGGAWPARRALTLVEALRSVEYILPPRS